MYLTRLISDFISMPSRNPKQIVRDHIDKQLNACSWTIQYMRQVNIFVEIGVAVKEYLTYVCPEFLVEFFNVVNHTYLFVVCQFDYNYVGVNLIICKFCDKSNRLKFAEKGIWGILRSP